MIEFLMLPHEAQLLFLFMVTILIILEMVNLLLRAFETHQGLEVRGSLPELVLSLSIFYIYFKLSLNKLFLDGLSMNMPTKFGSWFMVALMGITAVYCIFRGTGALLWIFLSGLLFCPPLEDLLSANYFYVMLAYLLAIFLRGFFKIQEIRVSLKKNITGFSAKEAVDKLPLGILSATPHGKIHLINPAMERLLYHFFHRTFRWDRDLWEALRERRMTEDPSSEEDLIHCPLGNEVYRFRRFEEKPGESYTYAYDLTEVFQTTKEIERANESLMATRKELKEVISRIDTMQREHEIIRIKSRMHDVIGFRISLIYRMLADGHFNKEDLDHSLELLREVRDEVRGESDPKAFFKFLNERLLAMDVSLEVLGTFPEDSPYRELILDTIREAIANAVKHGETRHIFINFERGRDQFLVTVENDGRLPQGPVVPRGGLRHLVRRARESQCEFRFSTEPRFQVELIMPLWQEKNKGENHE